MGVFSGWRLVGFQVQTLGFLLCRAGASWVQHLGELECSAYGTLQLEVLRGGVSCDLRGLYSVVEV